MKLPGRDDPDATRDLTRDRDRENRISTGHLSRFGQRQHRRHRRTAHVHDRLVVRVVELERLRERCVGKRGVRKANVVSAAKDPARPLRRDGNSARANRPAESRPFPRECQPDHIKDATLRRLDHIVRKVFESNARNPLSELTGKRHDHSPGA